MDKIPALSQTLQGKLSCEEGYALSVIDGDGVATSEPAERGSEIHHVMSEYVRWCASKEVTSDWNKFDELASAVGPEAGQILDGMRDSYVVDWEHVWATERWIGLDWELKLCLPSQAAYNGTLDAITLSGDQSSALITDYKSHWRPFEADTFQSKLYPFLLFQQIPTLEDVEFRLVFVRFKSAARSVSYSRADMPRLAEEIERARMRQIAIHAKPRSNMEVTPGSGCVYCAHLLRGTCPLAQRNPYGAMTLEDRLKQVVLFDQARKHQLTIIREFVDQAQRPVEFTAGSDKYAASFAASESGYYPLVESVAMLAEWVGDNPDDAKLWDNLRIGSTQLKSKLKAKKRADLDQRMRDTVMVKETSVRFAIRKNGEEEESE